VQRRGKIDTKMIFKGLFFLAFAVLPYISFAQNIDSTFSILKSGRRPRYQFKPFDFYQSNKKFSKSPFSIFSIKGSRNSIDFIQDKLISSQQLGDISITPSQAFSLSEFSSLQNRALNSSYWNDYSKSLDGNNSVQSRGLFPKIELPPAIDRIFGGTEISFKPNGSLLLDVGYMGQFVDNPAVPVQLRYVGNLFFNEQAQINFQGKIGEKLNLNTNFDTKASFNFQNQLKLNWKTQEEDILQNIEAGNTSWTLNSQLIPGVQNLFGLKTLLRFVNLYLTFL